MSVDTTYNTLVHQCDIHLAGIGMKNDEKKFEKIIIKILWTYIKKKSTSTTEIVVCECIRIHHL